MPAEQSSHIDAASKEITRLNTDTNPDYKIKDPVALSKIFVDAFRNNITDVRSMFPSLKDAKKLHILNLMYTAVLTKLNEWSQDKEYVRAETRQKFASTIQSMKNLPDFVPSMAELPSNKLSELAKWGVLYFNSSTPIGHFGGEVKYFTQLQWKPNPYIILQKNEYGILLKGKNSTGEASFWVSPSILGKNQFKVQSIEESLANGEPLEDGNWNTYEKKTYADGSAVITKKTKDGAILFLDGKDYIDEGEFINKHEWSALYNENLALLMSSKWNSGIMPNGVEYSESRWALIKNGDPNTAWNAKQNKWEPFIAQYDWKIILFSDLTPNTWNPVQRWEQTIFDYFPLPGTQDEPDSFITRSSSSDGTMSYAKGGITIDEKDLPQAARERTILAMK